MSRPPSDSTKPDSASRPRALFLAAEAPYPTVGGGPMRATSVLEYLASRFSVHGIFFREPGAPDPAAAVPAGKLVRADVIDLPFHSKAALARAARNTWRLIRNQPPLIDRFAGFAPQIERCLQAQRYEAAFIEHFWCAPYVDQLRPVAERVIVDVYNVESAWHQSMANSEGGALGWAHRRFARAALASERRWFPRFDRILTTSQDDARIVQSISPGAKVTVYPNALPLVAQPSFAHPPGGERCEIVFSGNLEYGPNIQAVRFFHRHIWPELKSRWPGLRWKILSRNAGAFRDLPATDPQIEITGFVEDAVAVIAEAQVAVVPLLAGSGTRIKILEAWAAGTPVVSTTIGAEGLEFRAGEHLILADDAGQFAGAVSRLLGSAPERTRLGAAGRRLYEERYTWNSVWKALEDALNPAMVDLSGETRYDYQ